MCFKNYLSFMTQTLKIWHEVRTMGHCPVVVESSRKMSDGAAQRSVAEDVLSLSRASGLKGCGSSRQEGLPGKRRWGKACRLARTSGASSRHSLAPGGHAHVRGQAGLGAAELVALILS